MKARLSTLPGHWPLATGHWPLRRAFTLVELLVAFALVMLVMVILSQAFVTGLDTFRGLKAIGDLQEDMRTAANLLKADLGQDFFEAKRRPSDPIMNSATPTYLPIRSGFLKIVQDEPSIIEGYDRSGIPSFFAGDTPFTTPPIDGNKHWLHFASKQRGNQYEKFFSAQVPPISPLYGIGLPIGPGPGQPTTLVQNLPVENNAAARDPLLYPGVYKSPWAEIAWFLLPQGTTVEPNRPPPAGVGAPLYGLYRAQFVVPADTRNLNVPGFATTAAMQPGVACIDDPVLGYTVYRSPDDLINPAMRIFNMNNPTRAATLVLKNVLNFQVQILHDPSHPDFYDVIPPYSGGTYDSSINPFPIHAIRIVIRTWDNRSQTTRQITIIQDL